MVLNEWLTGSAGQVGQALLAIALASLLVAGPLLLRGARSRASGGLFALAAAATSGALLLLLSRLAAADFSYRYVAEHVNRDLSLFYRVAALWSGQEGSLLFWLWLLLLYGCVVAFLQEREAPELARPAAGIISLVGAFFAGLVVFVEPPFQRLAPAPPEGAGLNPILQSYWMALHPVFLYLGYTGYTVPFAFAMAALARGRTDPLWLRLTRRWAVVAWLFLSIGILFGSRWAYEELGWGGYWGWDPVENGSLLPWLVGTAYLHSVMAQEKRGLLKVWNVLLILTAFLLTLFGTLVTRSGLISSVHAFVESEVGPLFLVMMGLVAASGLYLVAARLPLLKDDERVESYLSKEASFLLNNLLMLALAFAILWGTLLPLLSPLFGVQLSAGAPYFNRVTGPLFLGLVFLMGVGPMLGWRRSSRAGLKRALALPLAAGGVTLGVLFLLGVREGGFLLAMAGAVFVVGTAVWEVARATRARQRLKGEPVYVALPRLLNQNPRRYGGYMVHVAVMLLVVGVGASQYYQERIDTSLAVGEDLAVGPYRLTFAGLQEGMAEGGARETRARLVVWRGDERLGLLEPARREYPTVAGAESGPTTEVTIYSTLAHDLYVVLAGWTPFGERIGLQVYFTPGVAWIWLGGLLLIVGTVFAVWPRRREESVTASVFSDLATLEYDFAVGKLTLADYRALRAQYVARAGAFLAAEERATRAVLAELEAEGVLPPPRGGWGGGGRRAAPAGLALLLVGALAGLAAPPARAAALQVPWEALVVRRSPAGEGLAVADLVTVANPGSEAAPLRLAVPPGATGVAVRESGGGPVPFRTAGPGEIELPPLAPGARRSLEVTYSLPQTSWPVAVRRAILHATDLLLVLTPVGDLTVSGVGGRAFGRQSIAGHELEVLGYENLPPSESWQVLVEPPGLLGQLGRVRSSLLADPLDLLRRAGPGGVLVVAGLVLALLGALAGTRLAEERRLRQLARRGAGRDGAGGRAGVAAGREEALEHLILALANLDLSYQHGHLSEAAWRARRHRLKEAIRGFAGEGGPGGGAVAQRVHRPVPPAGPGASATPAAEQVEG